MYYKQWKKSLKLEPFECEYLKRYGILPCYEKDYDLVNQRMDEIWKDMRMTEEEKELKALQEQCPW